MHWDFLMGWKKHFDDTVNYLYVLFWIHSHPSNLTTLRMTPFQSFLFWEIKQWKTQLHVKNFLLLLFTKSKSQFDHWAMQSPIDLSYPKIKLWLSFGVAEFAQQMYFMPF